MAETLAPFSTPRGMKSSSTDRSREFASSASLLLNGHSTARVAQRSVPLNRRPREPFQQLCHPSQMQRSSSSTLLRRDRDAQPLSGPATRSVFEDIVLS